MAESKSNDIVSRLLSGFFGQDVVEERLVNYLVREIHRGRKLEEVMRDPYITNRLDEDRIHQLLNNPEVIQAVEQEVAKAFETGDFGFKA